MKLIKEQEAAMDDLSEQDLEEIEQRCLAATPGPWKLFVEGRDCQSGSSFIQTDGEDIYLSGATVADQDFIASARQDIPRWIAEISALWGKSRL